MPKKENILLEKLQKDMEKQSPLYKPTTFWKEASQIIIDELLKKDLKDFRSFDSALGMFVPTFAFPYYLKDIQRFKPVQKLLQELTEDKKSNLKLDLLIKGENQAFADYRVLQASNINAAPYLDQVSESSIGNPLEQFEFNKRKFSRSFLNYLLGLSFLKQNIDTSEIKNVFEIGGGFGTLGEILLSESRNKDYFYINADIPPVVHISSYYLKKVFGDSNIGTYEELKDYDELNIKELKKQYKALNIPSWQVPKLKGTIDLFVNFISFQEMEPEVVQNYYKHISRLQAKYILQRNILEGKKKQSADAPYGVTEPITGGNYDTFLPEYKLIATDSSIFGFKTEDNFHSQLRLYERY
ncbi:MAG: putative sugar O-methyltransferase [Sulfurimonas sp.]|nr:putative sugar O-methyltransferase [Sulfurimonas sp.]MDQ7059865.1 putative sugar O-methyltransferase [Sulfurimonas sp.]